MKYRLKYTAKRALIGEKRLKEILEKFFAIKIYIAFYLVNFFFFKNYLPYKTAVAKSEGMKKKIVLLLLIC